MGKVTKIPSELRKFFTEKRSSAIFEVYSRMIENLKINSKHLGGVKRSNCQLTNLQVFQILLLLPFFTMKTFAHYGETVLSHAFGGKKDILYAFASQDNIDWRGVIYRIVGDLIARVVIRKDHSKASMPSVLIADDSDLPKTGMRIEAIGKIFSHVHQKCILGFKALALCWSDGRTQFVVDYSMHGERGKVEGKEQGLTAAQRAKRYSRERDKDSCAARRKEEYFSSKLERLKEMVKRAIKAKIPFDYLLVDSWFTCASLVDFVCKNHKKFHLLGMAKMGKTKYQYGKIEASAKVILSALEKKKAISYSRKYRCHYATADVKLNDRKVRIFFCRRSKNEGWKILLTTNTSLDFMKAYEIYAMRWAIEVFFSDSKRLLGMADCSARDFSSQIAHVSLVIIRYNLLASIKRSMDYETIGGLFVDIYEGVHELTVVEKIWDIILEVIAVVAEITGAESDKLLTEAINNSTRLEALRQFAQAA